MNRRLCCSDFCRPTTAEKAGDGCDGPIRASGSSLSLERGSGTPKSVDLKELITKVVDERDVLSAGGPTMPPTS